LNFYDECINFIRPNQGKIVMTLILKTSNTTILKRKPIQALELPETQKQRLDTGKELEIESYLSERDHIRVAFARDYFKGYNTWYAYARHIQILENGSVVLPKPKPNAVRLEVPYKSQLDNEENPTGSCNVTSIAMCLAYLGAKRRQSSGQFEDELYNYTNERNLSRHDPNDLASVVKAYGCCDDFRTNATIEQVQDWLMEGKPAVIHGYFTSFGHIIALVGFDETGFLVHDPYGEWTTSGYDCNVPGTCNEKGKYMHYSYGMIQSLCIPDGSFWVHFLS
jgi:uncharacterized protein YvpB